MSKTVVSLISSSQLPLAQGECKLSIYHDSLGAEHSVLQFGKCDSNLPVLVRLHSSCLTGDTFGSLRCDCGKQLHAALEQIANEGGILLYLQQEGRGIGLANKVKAYALQETGLDTVEANHELGFADDLRDYAAAAEILHQLNATKIRLLTNNPKKMQALQHAGIEVISREPIVMQAQFHNSHYLNTKRDKLGHLLPKDTK